MNYENEPKKPGLLCEDINTLETIYPDGTQRLERTTDRTSLARSLSEADEDTRKPLHESDKK